MSTARQSPQTRPHAPAPDALSPARPPAATPITVPSAEGAARPTRRGLRSRLRYQRLAWLVLLASFVTFLLIVIGGPLAARHYLNTATVVRPATLEVIQSIVQVDAGANSPTLAVTDRAPVTEGQTITTGPESRALLTLFDNSTLQIYPRTEVRVVSLREPRFARWGLSNLPNDLAFEVVTGTIRVGVALPGVNRTTPAFVTTTPNVSATLVEGGYFFDVNVVGTNVHAYNNRAEVTSLYTGQTVTLHRGERTSVAPGASPSPPTATEYNYITNGDFSSQLNDAWKITVDQGGDGPSVDPEADIVNTGDRWALHFYRTGAEYAPGRGNHATIKAVQTLNRNLPDPYSSLRLRAEVRILNQSLSGGGYLATEYPLILRVVYKDAYGSLNEWWKGFYVQNDAGNPVTHGVQVRQGVWAPVEFDLRQEIPNLPPFQIVSVEARAAGWDFDSQVSDLRLIVR